MIRCKTKPAAGSVCAIGNYDPNSPLLYCTRWRCNLKGLSRDRGWAIFAENLRASPLIKVIKWDHFQTDPCRWTVFLTIPIRAQERKNAHQREKSKNSSDSYFEELDNLSGGWRLLMELGIFSRCLTEIYSVAIFNDKQFELFRIFFRNAIWLVFDLRLRTLGSSKAYRAQPPEWVWVFKCLSLLKVFLDPDPYFDRGSLYKSLVWLLPVARTV